VAEFDQGSVPDGIENPRARLSDSDVLFAL